jgi:hypothetical protein
MEEMNIDRLKKDMIHSAQRGYPVFISGAIYWFVMWMLSGFTGNKLLSLIYILGMGSIFPLGMMISAFLKVNMFATPNPLGKLGGLIGGIQMFFLPIYIFIYQHHPEWIPFFIAILGGSHFIPYAWIYNSKAYYFHSVGMVSIGTVFAFQFKELVFTVLPILMAFVYMLTTVLLIWENKRESKK